MLRQPSFRQVPGINNLSKFLDVLIRLRLTIVYDGSGYVGWQRQKNGISIQQVIEEKLEEICGSRVVVHGASRTDTGVHALGMVVSLDWPATAPKASVLQKALNALLPEDIRVLRIKKVSNRFHARFSAETKLYRYRILNTSLGDPFRRAMTWFVHKPLNLISMRKAARLFVGKHDFSAVAVNPGYQRSSMMRHISRCRVLRRSDEIHIEVEGNGFLYKMVRTMVGTLVEVGLGKRSAESISELLQSRDRQRAGKTAPPHGLFLVRVNYNHKRGEKRRQKFSAS